MTQIQSPHPELEGVEVHGMTRGSFILRGALATGSVYGLGLVAPFVSSALAAEDTTDLDIVNFALTLEYLEAAFYKEAQKLKLSGAAKKYAKSFGETEQEHVTALIATAKSLKGKPAAMPKFKFPMTDEKSFLKLAQTLEDTGVGAYNGAGPSIKNKDILAAAGSIVQVEARHAAAIRLLNGQPPAPEAFDKPLDMATVLAAVKPLIVA
jgi:Ferritin-like domain